MSISRETAKVTRVKIIDKELKTSLQTGSQTLSMKVKYNNGQAQDFQIDGSWDEHFATNQEIFLVEEAGSITFMHIN